MTRFPFLTFRVFTVFAVDNYIVKTQKSVPPPLNPPPPTSNRSHVDAVKAEALILFMSHVPSFFFFPPLPRVSFSPRCCSCDGTADCWIPIKETLHDTTACCGDTRCLLASRRSECCYYHFITIIIILFIFLRAVENNSSPSMRDFWGMMGKFE